MQSIAWTFRVGKSTVHTVVKETCAVIWEALKDEVLKFPSTQEEWKDISATFKKKWNFDHCLGAIDGKHIRIQAPPLSGSKYFNYKHYHSINLMAACDADLCFTFVDIGSPGRNSDGGVFGNTGLGNALNGHPENLKIPIDGSLKQDGKSLPYVFVADEAFPLRLNLMRPYPGRPNLTERQDVFNYRLSRARRLIENAFGVLTQRWRFLRKDLIALPENVVCYMQAVVVLHNWLRRIELRRASSRIYIPPKYVDHVGQDDEIVDGKWREEKRASGEDLECIDGRHMGSNNYPKDAAAVREGYADYFLTPAGAVEWQYRHVRRGRKTNPPT